jgi:hypothetical protein
VGIHRRSEPGRLGSTGSRRATVIIALKGGRGARALTGTLSFIFLGAVLVGCSSPGRAPATPGQAPGAPTLRFEVITKTNQKLDSLVWTGTQFLYVQNTANTVWAAPPAGHPLTQFARMPRLVEETRCILSPGAHGFPADTIFCHSPDNKIYEISPNGSSVTVFAILPANYPPASDGMLAFDSVGRFGYRLIAATGRSGGARPMGGLVYAIDAQGHVQSVGSYGGPGGADELVIAPNGFGSAAGDALLTVDAGKSGAVVAMDRSGTTRTIETFPEGPNPIAAIPQVPVNTGGTGAPLPGLYVNDDSTGYTYLAPASDLARYAGDVIVGSEARADFWILEPTRQGFAKVPLRNNLPAGTYSLEQAIFVSN